MLATVAAFLCVELYLCKKQSDSYISIPASAPFSLPIGGLTHEAQLTQEENYQAGLESKVREAFAKATENRLGHPRAGYIPMNKYA